MSAKRNDISQIDNYLKSKLDNRAMHQLERAAQDDPFLMDALDGFEIIDTYHDANLAELKGRLADRVVAKKDRRVLLWRILPVAASLLLIIGGYWFFELPAKRPQAHNVVRINRQMPATNAVKKPAKPESLKTQLNRGKYLAKNNTVNRSKSLRRQPYIVDTNKGIGIKNNFIAKLGIKDILGHKTQYGFQSSSTNQNQTIGNLNKNSLIKGRDNSLGRYLNKDLLAVNAGKKIVDSSTAYFGAAPAPVIRGYVKRTRDQTTGASYIITGREVQDNPVGNVDQLLQGRVAPLNIHNNNLIVIVGKVTDTAGRPLPGILVGNALTSTTTTDRNGIYSLKINKDSALVASGFGYKKQSALLNPGASKLDFKLQEAPRQLAEVDIRGYVKRTRDQTTGASYIITGKNGPCKENLRFKKRFFDKIAIAERYVTEHANGQTPTVRDRKFLRALKYIAKRAPTTIKVDKTVFGYTDLKTFAQNKANWLYWYEVNKCNNLK